MLRVAHIIGNGDQSRLFLREERKGLKLTCNLPPFPVENAYATCIVDFKMMAAITKGEIDVPGEWVVGMRPKIWMDKNPKFFMQRSQQIKEFFTELPKYVSNYTDFNCGHMATYYASRKFKPDEVHMYGFDSLFDFNLRSCTDFYLPSPRDTANTSRLADNWRPIWQNMFKDFSNVKFVLHHTHDKIKFPVSSNVEVKIYKPLKEKNVKK